MEQLSGAEIMQALRDALHDIEYPKPPDPVCGCGSFTAIQHGGGVGFVCERGHRLPGQDLPRELTDARPDVSWVEFE